MYSPLQWFISFHAKILKMMGAAMPSPWLKVEHHGECRDTGECVDEQKSRGKELDSDIDGKQEESRPTTTTDLCHVCYNLRPSLHTTFEPGQDMHYYMPCYREFVASSKSGCATCSFVVASVLNLGETPADNWLIFVNFYECGACDLMVAGTAQNIQIYTPIGQYPAWEKIIHADELSPGANSPQAIEFIKSCISKCDASHPSCQRTSSDLPSRLVDVGHDEPSHIRIVEAAHLSGEQYLALSYCWGDGQKIMTTRANYAAMHIGFSIEDLPQTLKDAISLTRQLGHRYIWIDSLCIMQDCNGDWEHEARTMASVYRNAYLTIAANTAAAASEGFLKYQHATTEYPTPLKVPWRTEEGIDTILASRVIPNSYTHVDGQDDPLPLETRGWGLQERVLSTRILSYTANELQWICQSAQYCECGKISQTVTHGHSPNEMRTKMRGPIFQLTAAEAWDKWKMLVDTYSSRLLTNPEDKLPAIAGVASVIQDITGSKYIAGLWENDLVLDLTWDTAQWGNEDLNTLPCSLEKYVAPTFSWASLPMGVSFARGSRYYMSPCKWYPECEVINSGTELRGTNPLGQVNGGFVKLRGSMAKAELQTHIPEGRTAQGIWHVQFRAERFGFLPDTRLEEFLWNGEDGASENSVRRSPFGSQEKIIQPGAVVYVFSLGYWKAVDQGRERWHHNYLILGRSAGKTGVFERIGFCIGKKMDVGGSRGELCEELEKVEITLV